MPKLYVILRGEFALYVDQDANGTNSLFIDAPAMPGHDYRAGKSEDVHKVPDLPDNVSLSLKEATGGGCNPVTAKHPDGDYIFMNVGAPRGHSHGSPRFRAVLPLPVAILPGLRENTESVVIEVTPPQKKTRIPSNPVVIAILEYDFAAGANPYLTDGTNQYHASDRQGNKVIHLVASGAWPELPKHAKDAFAAAALLLGVDAKLSWTTVSPAKVSPVPPDSGLTDEDVNQPWGMERLTPEQPLTSAQIQARLDARAALEESMLGPDPEKGSGNCGPVVECPDCN